MLITDVHSKQRFCLVKISPIFHLLVTHAQKKPEDEKKTGRRGHTVSPRLDRDELATTDCETVLPYD